MESTLRVYEPGVSIDGSMPTEWMPGYEKKLAEKENVDALVEFTLADAPPLPRNRWRCPAHVRPEKRQQGSHSGNGAARSDTPAL